MEELDKIKPTNATIKIRGKERNLKYGFSAWAEIEKKYGSVQNFNLIQDDIQVRPFQTLPFLIYIGLTDKEGITVDDVLDDYGINDIQYVAETFTKALYGSLPENNKKKVTKKE